MICIFVLFHTNTNNTQKDTQTLTHTRTCTHTHTQKTIQMALSIKACGYLYSLLLITMLQRLDGHLINNKEGGGQGFLCSYPFITLWYDRLSCRYWVKTTLSFPSPALYNRLPLHKLGRLELLFRIRRAIYPPLCPIIYPSIPQLFSE